MYFKQKLAYMALGCLFTIIGYILASLSGDVDAQSQGDKSEPTIIDVDRVVCRILEVVNDDGETVVLIFTDSNGGYIGIRHASGEMAIKMGIDDEFKEGLVQVRTKDQKGGIHLSANEYGGGMVIFNKGSKNVLQASVGDSGGGIINTRDKHGYRTGRLP
jgi:hypothetical protein